jgi:hypothetical protein
MINLLRDFQTTGSKAFPLIRDDINVVSEETIAALSDWKEGANLHFSEYRDLVRTRKGELFGLIYDKITSPILIQFEP